MSNALVLTLVVMLICLFLKVPVFIAILTGSLAYFLLNPTVSLTLFAQRMIIGTQSLSLLAIPFFVCAGVLMNYSGVTRRLMRFCEAVTGRLNGGLALVNVMLSTVMGGLSGSNLAAAGSGNGAYRIFQIIFQCGNSSFIHDYAADSAGNCFDPLWISGQYFYWKIICSRNERGSPALCMSDGFCFRDFKEERLSPYSHRTAEKAAVY